MVLLHLPRDHVDSPYSLPVSLNRLPEELLLVVDNQEVLGASDGYVEELELCADMGELAVDLREAG